jgi:hypothetical protein
MKKLIKIDIYINSNNKINISKENAIFVTKRHNIKTSENYNYFIDFNPKHKFNDKGKIMCDLINENIFELEEARKKDVMYNQNFKC